MVQGSCNLNMFILSSMSEVFLISYILIFSLWALLEHTAQIEVASIVMQPNSHVDIAVQFYNLVLWATEHNWVELLYITLMM